jgi:hypothetical protein
MEIKNVLLLSEAEDLASKEPVLAKIEADASNLGITLTRGEEKASILIWHRADGKLCAQIQNSDQYQAGAGAEEITLIGIAKTLQPLETAIAEVEPASIGKPEISENFPEV